MTLKFTNDTLTTLVLIKLKHSFLCQRLFKEVLPGPFTGI